jgi:hypothetical protein
MSSADDGELSRRDNRKINGPTSAVAILVALTALLGSFITGRLGADSANKNTEATLRGQSNQARCDTLRSQRLSAYHEYFASAKPEQSAEWAMYLMVTSPDVVGPGRYAQPDPAEFDAQLQKAAIGIGPVQVSWLYARVISTPDVQVAGDALSADFDLEPFFDLDVKLHTSSVAPEDWDKAVESFNDARNVDDKAFDVFTNAVAKELNARCE